MAWNVHFSWKNNVILFHVDVNVTYLFRSNMINNKFLMQQIFFKVSWIQSSVFALSWTADMNSFPCRDEGAEAVSVGGDRAAAGVPGHRQPAVQVRHSPDGRLPHALHPR